MPAQKELAGWTLKQENFKTIENLHGLTNTFIDGILEDRSGQLWFSGNGGIYLYDPVAEAAGGKAFQDLSEDLKLKGVAINDIMEDSEGLFWIATENFVCRYDPDAAGDSAEKTYDVLIRVMGW